MGDKGSYGHKESPGESVSCEKCQPSCVQLLNGSEITMRALDVFGNLGSIIGKSGDLSVSLGK